MKFNKKAALFLLSLYFVFAAAFTAMAQVTYTNPETGYRVYIEDNAKIIPGGNLMEIMAEMEAQTAFGHAILMTTAQNGSSTQSYARDMYHNMVGTESGSMFLIDMDNRMLYIFSDGNMYSTINKGNAETITDNVFRYASNGQYGKCAAEAFHQINALMNGERIARPMKYISNFLIAIFLGLLGNYIFMNGQRATVKANAEALIDAAKADFSAENPNIQLTNRTRRYDPVKSSSSSGGGGGGGHSSHSSGGGGGHRF